MSIESDPMEPINLQMMNDDDDILIEIFIHIDSPGIGGTLEKVTTGSTLLPGNDATHTSRNPSNPTTDEPGPITNEDSGVTDMVSIDPIHSDDKLRQMPSGGTELPMDETSNPEVMNPSTTNSTGMPEPTSVDTSTSSTTSAETTDPTTTPKQVLVFYDPLSANDNTSGFVGDLVMAGAALIRGIKDVPIDLFYVFYDGLGNAIHSITRFI